MMPQRGSRGPSPAESIGWAGADGALPGSGDAARDRGSSVAEFSLVVVMLMLIFLGLISVGLWAYTRVLLTSAAAAAARYVADADVFDAGAADKVQQDWVRGSWLPRCHPGVPRQSAGPAGRGVVHDANTRPGRFLDVCCRHYGHGHSMKGHQVPAEEVGVGATVATPVPAKPATTIPGGP